MVSKAPDGNLVRWRCADVKAEIEKRGTLKIEVHHWYAFTGGAEWEEITAS